MANSMETLELQPNRQPEIALAQTLAVFVLYLPSIELASKAGQAK